MAVCELGLSPEEFWKMSFNEFFSIIKYKNPNLEKDLNGEFFSDEEKLKIEQMKARLNGK